MKSKNAISLLKEGKELRLYVGNGINHHFKYTKKGIKVHDGTFWHKPFSEKRFVEIFGEEGDYFKIVK